MIARHDLLVIDDIGREHAFREAVKRSGVFEKQAVYELISDSRIPPIVKRQESQRDGYWEVGFSSYRIFDGVRMRVASIVPQESVIRVITPFDVLEGLYDVEGFPLADKLEALVSLGGITGVRVGLFGSTALNIVTGLPYLNAQSDIDVYIQAGICGDVYRFAKLLRECAALKDTKLDIELDIGDGFSVKLFELLSDQKTVLAKGLLDAKIIDRIILQKKCRTDY